MSKTISKPDVQVRRPENIGVINPYALAEIQLGQKVDWKMETSKDILVGAFNKPYEELFDPQYDSPLYTGLELNPRTMQMKRVARPAVAMAVTSDRMISVAGSQASVVWKDPGNFFNEATEMKDPVQGAVGDCYFIAALSSVAWATTYFIAHRTRATGINQSEFIDMVEFWGNGSPTEVEITELLPLNSPSNAYIYAHSSEKGETWPAIYEKAYAKWRTNTTSDTPDYNLIAGGDPVAACKHLTGKSTHYRWNADLSEESIWQYIRENCISRKTFNPMVTWTYPTGQASPNHVNYNSAQLVANHAYSILGWHTDGNKKYVVLRNPWGTYEANLNIATGNWLAYNTAHYGSPGFWETTKLTNTDGIFALQLGTFKSFFSGFGWVEVYNP